MPRVASSLFRAGHYHFQYKHKPTVYYLWYKRSRKAITPYAEEVCPCMRDYVDVSLA